MSAETFTAWRDERRETNRRSTAWRQRLDSAVRRAYSEVERAELQANPRYEGYRVTVARGPGHVEIVVPSSRLVGWHVAVRTGRFAYPKPMICGYMLCSDVPEEKRDVFGHTCSHGPGPHLIRVAVVPRGVRMRLATMLVRCSRLARITTAGRGNSYPVALQLKRHARRHAVAYRPMLSDRQAEILALLAKGLSTDQVADKLGSSRKQMKKHRQRIYRHLHVGTRPEAIEAAQKLGLIPTDASEEGCFAAMRNGGRANVWTQSLLEPNR